MIYGVGVDLIEINRVIRACQNENFLRRYYTAQEIELVQQDTKKAADNFAVKEAVAKALGVGFRGFSPKDIEVLRDEFGKPFVNLYGNAAVFAVQMGVTTVHVSISNTKIYSNAMALAEKLDNTESVILERDEDFLSQSMGETDEEAQEQAEESQPGDDATELSEELDALVAQGETTVAQEDLETSAEAGNKESEA